MLRPQQRVPPRGVVGYITEIIQSNITKTLRYLGIKLMIDISRSAILKNEDGNDTTVPDYVVNSAIKGLPTGSRRTSREYRSFVQQ